MPNGWDDPLFGFGGAGHAFTDQTMAHSTRPGMRYEPNADRRSWQAMRNFLDELFGGARPSDQ